METNMTALISCFARDYHFQMAPVPIFADGLAGKLLSEEERQTISRSMAEGADFFLPGFSGSGEEDLRAVVEGVLAPPVLARGAFCEDALATAVRLGCGQYVLFGAGYDTFPLRCPWPGLRLFALDRPEVLSDCARRRDRAGLKETCPTVHIPCELSREGWQTALLEGGFDRCRPAFGSLLGLVCYLSREEFDALLGALAPLWSPGSSLCFDYPAARSGEESRKTRQLAAAAGSPMRAAYSYGELEALLAAHGFLLYEHLDEREATERFFGQHNAARPQAPMSAPAGVCCCLAVREP